MSTQIGRWTEPVLLQMKAILAAGIPAILNTIDTEHSSDFTLEDPRLYKIGQIWVLHELPAIVVWPEGDASIDYSQDTPLFRPTVTVWACCADTDEERLQRRLYRYQDAIIRCLQATKNLDTQVDEFNIAGLRYDSPWVAGDESSFMNAVGVRFEVVHEELYT